MNNKYLTSLYIYTDVSLRNRGKYIAKPYIQKALDNITATIDNCCKINFKRTSKSQFLTMFNNLLLIEGLPKNTRKLKEVQKLLQKHLNCCS